MTRHSLRFMVAGFIVFVFFLAMVVGAFYVVDALV